ncbi:hypothetical protein ACIBH1_18715 [Nonomuraea sp. NPDC050663]|uniref:hypothetical protein n=1 Tax=Nonomuraea sp. NPDC050663 TaxID=3364370 RepID=UPI0037A39BD3
MKRTALALAALTAGMLLPTTAAQAAPGPETCRQGYVWRVARAADLVCVTPAMRDEVATDNHHAAGRWVEGAYGPHTCAVPYVWRNAFAGDDVCVTTDMRNRVARDNAASSDRKVLAKVWISGYRPEANRLPRIQVNGSHFNLGEVRMVIRWSHNDAVWWSGKVTAKRNAGFGGGSFGYRTGKLECSSPGKPYNGYAYAYDVLSGRTSTRVPVHIGCALL